MLEVSACADIPQLMWGKRVYPYPGANLGSGNRCGHDPAKFASDRIVLPVVQGGHWPKAIQNLMAGIKKYFSEPDFLSLLAYPEKHRSGKLRAKRHDGTPRLNRSESRETHALILSAIFSRLDLKSLRVGTYTAKGEFKNATCDELASFCRLVRPHKDPERGLTASSRWWRGVGDLKKAGVIEVFEQYEDTPEGPRARPAIKVLDERFLLLLSGMTKKAFQKARKTSHEKVLKFLGKAGADKVLTKKQREELTDSIRSSVQRDDLKPVSVVKKNQAPVELQAMDDDLELAAWQAHDEQVQANIAESLGRQPTIKERLALWASHGGVSWGDWLSRRR